MVTGQDTSSLFKHFWIWSTEVFFSMGTHLHCFECDSGIQFVEIMPIFWNTVWNMWDLERLWFHGYCVSFSRSTLRRIEMYLILLIHMSSVFTSLIHVAFWVSFYIKHGICSKENDFSIQALRKEMNYSMVINSGSQLGIILVWTDRPKSKQDSGMLFQWGKNFLFWKEH